MIRTVELVDPLVEVLHVVGVHQIHHHRKFQFVSRAHERLERFGRAEARGRGEEVRHVVAERPVIGMFGDAHQLYRIVTLFPDPGKNLFGEFRIAAHAFALLSHTYVGFVDE